MHQVYIYFVWLKHDSVTCVLVREYSKWRRFVQRTENNYIRESKKTHQFVILLLHAKFALIIALTIWIFFLSRNRGVGSMWKGNIHEKVYALVLFKLNIKVIIMIWLRLNQFVRIKIQKNLVLWNKKKSLTLSESSSAFLL